MIYGLGVLDMLGFLYEIDTVELTIVQPRIEHFSTWEISAEELLAWGKDVLEPGAAKATCRRGRVQSRRPLPILQGKIYVPCKGRGIFKTCPDGICRAGPYVG